MKKERHRKISFKDEWIAILKERGVEFEEKYLF